MELAEVVARMGMKPSEVASWHDVDDGVLVVTGDGAQTLLTDAGVAPVVPPRPIPERKAPIRVKATVGPKKA